jgi:hypothetical protein
MKSFSQHLIEQASKESVIKEAYDDTIEFNMTVRDPDGQLEKLLTAIKEVAGVGHSFTVVVDPDASEEDGGNQKFFIDGDGAFSIKTIKVKRMEKKE